MLITMQGAHCLQPLMTPPRGIYAVGIVLIEYRLIIKGQKEEEDQVLIDGYSIYAPSFYADFQKLIWHINTGHFGTIDLTIFAIPQAVLVDLEFEVCQIEDNHEHDSLAIVATYFNINTSFIIFNGKLGVGKLPPLTLSARHDTHFSITVYKYYNHSGCHPDGVVRNCRFGTEYDFEDFLCESLSFTPQKYGKSSKILSRNLDGIQMAMKSTWSIMCEPCL